MKKDSKERLFEVMGRLDKTFKPQLNEELEDIEASAEEVPAELPAEEVPAEEPVEEQSPEEKLAEITAKVDELHAMLHGEDESPAEEPEAEEEEGEIEVEIKPEDDEVEVEIEETLNEDHLKDRESQVKFICKNDKDCKEEDLKDLSDEEVKKKYLALEKKMGIEESKEVPVAAVAKVGEAK